MAVDEGLAEVFRTALAEISGVSKRKMMGGGNVMTLSARNV
jgi:hypothetical protein